MGFTPLNGPPDDDTPLCEKCYRPILPWGEVISVINRNGSVSIYCSKFCKVVHRDQVTKREVFKILYHDED